MVSFNYPNRIKLAHLPTPLEPVEGLLGPDTPRLWIKRDDLTGSGLSGNKVRKLEFVVAEARAQGADTLITCGGLQSNHCRATALVGAKLGLKVHLLLREESTGEIDGNLLIDHLAGATVERVPPQEYFRSLETLLKQRQSDYQSEGRSAYIIPTGASDAVGIWGYIACAQELRNDFAENGISPKAIICATGSGGTQAGLSFGGQLVGLSSRVVGYAVCDSEEYFNRKALADITACIERYNLLDRAADISLTTRDGYIGPGYARGYPALFETIKRVASNTGLLLDPVYTGKAFHGMLSDIEAGVYGQDGDIVFVHTGGQFGLFPFKDEIFA